MLLPLGILASSGAALASYELISSTIVSSGVSSVTFSNLATAAAGYKHLQVRSVVRSERPSSNADDLYMRFNSDTGNNYSYHNLYGYTNSMYATSASSINLMYLGTTPGSTASAGQFSPFITDLFDFSSSTKSKVIRSVNGVPAVPIFNFYSGAWYSNSPITSISITTQGGNISVGSRFSLYGSRG